MSAWYMSVALSKSSVFICNESDYSSLIGRMICCVLPFELVISLRSNFILFIIVLYTSGNFTIRLFMFDNKRFYIEKEDQRVNSQRFQGKLRVFSVLLQSKLVEIFVKISVFCIKFYSSAAVLPSSLLVAHNSKFIYIHISYLRHLFVRLTRFIVLILRYCIRNILFCVNSASNPVSTSQIYQLLSVAFNTLCCFLPQFENPVE